jgi:ComF family protein
MRLFKHAKERMLDVLFPPRCVNCRQSLVYQSRFLCAECFDSITLNTAFVCPRCGARRIAWNDRCHPAVPYLLAPATHFSEPIPSLIHHFKYQRLGQLRLLLSALIVVHLKQLEEQFSSYAVVPMPLHPAKERLRGFNQSRELARIVADYFSLPLVEPLVRVKNTASQTQCPDAAARHHNVAGAFRCRDNVKGKNILLVDDITTSGATLSEAVATLKNSSAGRIIAAVVAKA